MAAMAADGAAQAINLTGLTLKGEMDMALRIGQYRSAALVNSRCSSLACYALLDDKALWLVQGSHRHPCMTIGQLAIHAPLAWAICFPIPSAAAQVSSCKLCCLAVYASADPSNVILDRVFADSDVSWMT